MYKIALIGAIAFGMMAFAQPGKEKSKSAPAEKSAKVNSPSNVKSPPAGNETKNKESKPAAAPIFNAPQQGKKGNSGGSKNEGGSQQKGSKGGQEKGGQVNPFGGKQEKGNQNGGGKSSKSNQPNFGKQEKGNHGGDKNKGDKHFDPKHFDGKKGGKNHDKGNYSKGYKGKGGKMHYEKGHPNFGYVYVNNHGYYSHKNYGQWRSQQAKNKHKHYHPLYEYQAIEGFHLLISRNVFLYSETEYKINLINVQLAKKRKANLITVVQYNAYVDRIVVLQRRRAALQINIVL